MTLRTEPVVKAQMLIRRPVAQVFDVITGNPVHSASWAMSPKVSWRLGNNRKSPPIMSMFRLSLLSVPVMRTFFSSPCSAT